MCVGGWSGRQKKKKHFLVFFVFVCSAGGRPVVVGGGRVCSGTSGERKQWEGGRGCSVDFRDGRNRPKDPPSTSRPPPSLCRLPTLVRAPPNKLRQARRTSFSGAEPTPRYLNLNSTGCLPPGPVPPQRILTQRRNPLLFTSTLHFAHRSRSG